VGQKKKKKEKRKREGGKEKQVGIEGKKSMQAFIFHTSSGGVKERGVSYRGNGQEKLDEARRPPKRKAREEGGRRGKYRGGLKRKQN